MRFKGIQKVLSVFLTIAIVFTIVTPAVMATEDTPAPSATQNAAPALLSGTPGTLNVADGPIVITATGYTQGSGTETAYTGAYVLSGSYENTTSSTSDFVTVQGGTVDTPIDITLDNVTINNANGDAGGAAIALVTDAADTYVKLHLTGISTLTAGGTSAGIAVNATDTHLSSLNIISEEYNKGTLNVSGGAGGAGIGTGADGKGGDITISGGNVTATGGLDGAGIGSGSGGTCGKITIGRGTVDAKTTYHIDAADPKKNIGRAAGIGNGFGGATESVTIRCDNRYDVPNVTATGGIMSAGIGRSCGPNEKPFPIITTGWSYVTACAMGDSYGRAKDPQAVHPYAGYVNNPALTTYKDSAHTVAGTDVLPINKDGSLVIDLYYVVDTREYDVTYYPVDYPAPPEFPEPITESHPAGAVVTVNLPTKPGYTAMLSKEWGGPYTDMKQFTMPAEEFGTYFYVSYQPNTDTPYTEEYYFRNLEDTEYAKDSTMTVTQKGTTDEAATTADKGVPGFTHASKTYENKTTTAQDTALPIAADGSLVIKHYYTRNTYNVTYTSNAPGGDPPDLTNQTFGETLTVEPDLTYEGWTFSGWATTDIAPSPKAGDNFTVPAKDVTFTGTWALRGNIPYTVHHFKEKADRSGYEEVTSAVENLTGVTGNAPVISYQSFVGYAPVPEKTTYSKTDTEASTNPLTIAGDNSLEVNVYYDLKSFVVTFDPHSGTLTGEAKQVTQEQAGTDTQYLVPPLPTAAREDYNFVGWTTEAVTDGGDTTGKLFDAAAPITKDCTIYACWKVKPNYMVTYHSNISMNDSTKTVNHGKTVPFAVNPPVEAWLLANARQDFQGWSYAAWDQNNLIQPGDKITPKSTGIELYAQWADKDVGSLKGLEIDAEGGVMTPKFDAGTKKYVFVLDNLTANMVVIPTSTIDNAEVVVTFKVGTGAPTTIDKDANGKYIIGKSLFTPGGSYTISVTAGEGTPPYEIEVRLGTLKSQVTNEDGSKGPDIPATAKGLDKAVDMPVIPASYSYRIQLRLKKTPQDLIDSNLKTAMEEEAKKQGERKILQFVDLSLWMEYLDQNGVLIEGSERSFHESKPVTVTLQVADIGTDLLVIRNHEGTLTVLPDEDGDPNTYTFSTGRFSTYALAGTAAAPVVPGGGGETGGGGTSDRYTLNFDTNGGLAVKSEQHKRGTVVALAQTTLWENHRFVGWYADQALTQKITEIKMNSNKTVYAKWQSGKELLPTDTLDTVNHFAYVMGRKDGKIHPEANITRAETAVIFFRLLRDDVRKENLTTTSSFADVAQDAWCGTEIATLTHMGILHGRTARVFDPDAGITRAEFAAIASRFASEAYEGPTLFGDISGYWAEDEINTAASYGWIQGGKDGNFRPKDDITRAETMVLVNRVLGRLPESKNDLQAGMITWPDNANNEAWFYLAVQEATNGHDYARKADSIHETWRKLLPPRDWAALER